MFFIDWVWVQTHACTKFGYKQKKKKKKKACNVECS